MKFNTEYDLTQNYFFLALRNIVFVKSLPVPSLEHCLYNTKFISQMYSDINSNKNWKKLQKRENTGDWEKDEDTSIYLCCYVCNAYTYI